MEARVADKQEKQKIAHDQHTKDRKFQTGDSVYIRNHGSGDATWKPGKVVSSYGQMMYYVKLQTGQVTRRHIDDIRTKPDHVEPTMSEAETDNALPDIKHYPENADPQDAKIKGPDAQVELANLLNVLCRQIFIFVLVLN